MLHVLKQVTVKFTVDTCVTNLIFDASIKGTILGALGTLVALGTATAVSIPEVTVENLGPE
jgi:hypothetical protein